MMAQDSSDRRETTLVTTPFDMATLLLGASESSAAAHALAAHEVACERGHEERAEFWQDVCAEIKRLRAQTNQEAARHAA